METGTALRARLPLRGRRTLRFVQGIFPEVHAPGKNDFNFLRRGRKFCEAILRRKAESRFEITKLRRGNSQE